MELDAQRNVYVRTVNLATTLLDVVNVPQD